MWNFIPAWLKPKAKPTPPDPQPLVTASILRAIMPYGRGRIDVYLAPLNAAMAEFSINTPERIAAFLAQIAHESGEFKYVEEIASGRAYEWRADLGNTEQGDGVKFKGRGLIQVTGRTNYAQCSFALFGDDRLLDRPELLEEPHNACRSACWYWHSRGLNALADAGKFAAITRKINGGTNGAAERFAYWEKAKTALAKGRA